jgi:rare lipoprotein A
LQVFAALFWLLGSLPPVQAQAPQAQFSQTGKASYYHDMFHGRKTASGERFNQKAYTCAHRYLPFNTLLKVTNTSNGKVTCA